MSSGRSRALNEESQQEAYRITTKPLTQILDEMDANIRAVAEAARKAEDAARAAREAAGVATQASEQAQRGAIAAREAGGKAAEKATRAAVEASAKAEETAKAAREAAEATNRQLEKSIEIFSETATATVSAVEKINEIVINIQERPNELSENFRDMGKLYTSTIYELGIAEHELTSPIQIVLEEYQKETVARLPELNLYASADTDTEAIIGLKQEIVKLYEDLESSNRRLGPLPESWLRTLRKLIVKKVKQD
jgi:hypothetical protein